eukprot:gb/GECH01000922.1/.p1 GENE.gb/GECH01000922.1/~~gb/GECH01000922.1/.p1  ORF type:complete len:344 (+),score=21.81 gb/GECH01000922.1/:1-1032(+)
MGNYCTRKKPNPYSGISDTSPRGGIDSKTKRIRRFHENNILCACIYGQHKLVTGGEDQRINLFDTQHRNIVQQFNGHNNDVQSVSTSSKDRIIVSSGRDTNIFVWRLNQENSELTTADKMSEHRFSVSTIRINPFDSEYLCSGSRDTYIKLWDLNSSQCILSRHIPRNLVTVLRWISPSTVVQAGEDLQMRLWDMRTGNVAMKFDCTKYFQLCMDVSEDSTHIVTGSSGFSGDGCVVRTWDVRSTKPVWEAPGHFQRVSGCGYVSGNTLLSGSVVSVSNDHTLRVWDEYGKCVSMASIENIPYYLLMFPYTGSRQQFSVGGSHGMYTEWEINNDAVPQCILTT